MWAKDVNFIASKVSPSGSAATVSIGREGEHGVYAYGPVIRAADAVVSDATLSAARSPPPAGEGELAPNVRCSVS